ncbi:peptide-methionine (S)-S-oxide reductase MsrA [Phyllobacterium sp. 0TCS1.6C]|uniref:peptide-methionine (S)-S-oxide reductase MsrA n=1 Tax=unclassified Phyllobacterium TaxID=2638441 RepID=UPI0022647B7F|nr:MULTISPECIES: peptide-methionine (S)-S-oxide reductase MsrA [unclassified Phyllobacterium]MCX8281197.1 peptide-methionine (S)-S-oxide reductase MsrA [Phyllobacterium sp. 0TCS1.6C]MCX8294516.1 peptide-methionine (S)-S-oxide reductase MsrA [Phyllobacterium sp. 0TCS1.6A]
MRLSRILFAAACLGFAAPAIAAETAVMAPPPALDQATPLDVQSIVLAGGCFWGVQGVYQHMKGVTSAVSGYSGGTRESADYDRVSNGDTGHAEAVMVTFDPKVVSLGKVLQAYFSVVHDPTQLNRQGPDVGTQYRSAIFTTTDEQQRIAREYIAQLDKAKVYSAPIVTKLSKLTAFYPAEAYHQDYATLHPTQPYIAYNDLPKIENLSKLFPEVYREKPVLVGDGKPTN